MTLHILTEDHYLDFLQPVEDNQQNKTVHAARLHTGQPGEQVFVCKLLLPNAFELGNEAIAHYLARRASVPSPPEAAIVHMPARIASQRIPLSISQDYENAEGDVVMWCTKKLPYRSIRATFRAAADRTSATMRILKSESGRRMAAFDHLTGHADRHDGNYLWAGRDECVAIDNEALFGYSDWRAAPLAFATQNQLLEEMRRQVVGGSERADSLRDLQSGMVFYGESHSAAVQSAQSEISKLITLLYGAHAATNVLTCLHTRSAADWMKSELGLI
jgi:hypothetical protein